MQNFSVLISFLIIIIFISNKCYKKDKISKDLSIEEKFIKKNCIDFSSRKKMLDKVTKLYDSDKLDLNDLVGRKNFLQRTQSINDMNVSIIISVVVSSLSNTINDNIKSYLHNNYIFSVVSIDIISIIITILVSFVIIWCLIDVTHSIVLDKDFNKYNTNELEIKLIDQYIEIHTSISDDEVLQNLRDNLIGKKYKYTIRKVYTK